MEKLNRTETDTILQKGVDFPVTVAHRNILHRLRILPSEKIFVVYPIVLAALLKISEIINQIDEQFLNMPEKDEEVRELSKKNILQNKDRLVKIIAIGIENKGEKPSKKLIRFLDKNLTTRECNELINLIRQLMGEDHFFASTISLKGMVLQKKSTPGS